MSQLIVNGGMLFRIISRNSRFFGHYFITTVIRRRLLYTGRLQRFNRCNDATIDGRMIERAPRRQIDDGAEGAIEAATLRAGLRFTRFT